jgi:type I restriction enzyme M protein
VTLPCTLWFLDKGKREGKRADQVLFIDARHTFHQVDRAQRDFTDAQIEFLANIVRLWRGEEIEANWGSQDLLASNGLDGGYADVLGLCKAATRDEIEVQGWSLNPGRYVGAKAGEAEDIDFAQRLEELHEEFERLTADAGRHAKHISMNVARLLEA